jgi:cystathionine beta-lyase/cystathionine gamma-synthase
VLTRYGLQFSYVDTSDLEAVERAMTPRTRLLFVETPTNPVLRLTDIAAVAGLAHRHGAILAVDNTFASPCLQKPLALGADLVMHSTTKYLNGHSDSVGGIVVAQRDEDIEWLGFIQNSAGAILSPFDSWLVLRGTKTLPLRMTQHTANGLALAKYLETHPRVTRVIYPGLASHPQHALARRQMPNGCGGMLSFEVESFEEARRVLNRFADVAGREPRRRGNPCEPSGHDDASRPCCLSGARPSAQRQSHPHFRGRRGHRGLGKTRPGASPA